MSEHVQIYKRRNCQEQRRWKLNHKESLRDSTIRYEGSHRTLPLYKWPIWASCRDWSIIYLTRVGLNRSRFEEGKTCLRHILGGSGIDWFEHELWKCDGLVYY